MSRILIDIEPKQVKKVEELIKRVLDQENIRYKLDEDRYIASKETGIRSSRRCT